METAKTILASGLRVIVVPMSGTSTITALVTAQAGSRYENRRTNGIAHNLEHIFFKGGKRYPTARSTAEAIEEIGGKFNAFTSRETVEYYVKVPAYKYRLALDVLSDMLFYARMDREDVEKERGVILQELHRLQDNPAALVSDESDLHVLGDQPLGWSIIGSEENIRRFSRRDFLRYRRTNYVAEKMVLTIAGNIDPDEAFSAAAEYFSEPLPPSTPALQYQPYRLLNTLPKLRLMERPTAQTHLILGMFTVSRRHPARHSAEVLAAILGQGMSSRLFLEVREKRGLAYAVSAWPSIFDDAGTLQVYAGVENDRVAEAVRVILEEFAKLRQEAVTEKELVKAKGMLCGKIDMALEDSYALASSAASGELHFGDPAYSQTKKRKIEAVTSDDLRIFAREFLAPDAIRLTIAGPHKDANEFESLFG